ncbi:MAG: porin family protein [Sulfurovum sp.]|nr:porin family protein [Sulfurovum sp.]
MNRKILLVVASCALASQVYAGGNTVSLVETVVPVPYVAESHVEEAHHPASKYYVVVKGMTVLGADSTHGHDTLEGDQGYGVGIDVGYRIGNGFAVEYDFSYSTNTVIETDLEGTSHEGDASYSTQALFLVYTHHLTDTVGLFVKAGYEYETEVIDDLGIDSDADGFAYALGLEYAMNTHYTMLVEYESADIEGPRGDAVFVGMMYNF